jgi:hypothetical protein
MRFLFLSFASNNARPWPGIIALYEGFLETPWGVAMHRLVTQLHAAGYVAAGLHGATSMTVLFLGRSTDVLNNPHLRIQPTTTNIRLQYEDGSTPPWSADVGFDEVFDRVERVLLKRARWFHRNAKGPLE